MDDGAVRLRVPEGQTVVHDLIRGDVEFDNSAIDDFVIARSDGSALYNLAVSVDDLDMEITHVVRGEDHLSNTPRQLMIMNALGRRPSCVRAPAAAARAGRQEAVQAPRRRVGPGAAGPGLPTRRRCATTSRCSAGATTTRPRSSPPRRWRRSSPRAGVEIARGVRREEAALDERALPARDRPGRADSASWRSRPATRGSARRWRSRGRSSRPWRVLAAVGLLLRAPALRREGVGKGHEGRGPSSGCACARAALAEAGPSTRSRSRPALRGVVEELDVKPMLVFQPVRVAISGGTVSPGIFESVRPCGREETLSRIDAALEHAAA